MNIVNRAQALDLLKNQEVVALPTETVYGLAARCDSEKALKKIFSTKKRPFFDPLILHVKNIQQAQAYGVFDPVSEILAKEYWPGPLTLVLKKTEKVSSLVNNGGSTVALRSPNHPVFLELIDMVNVPLAAPSANMFGKTSPTEAQHVLKEFLNQVPVVDGGTCNKGIESTVIEVLNDKKIINILRPGTLTGDQIEKFLTKNNFQFEIEYATKNKAPGFLENHYQPSVPFLLIECESDDFQWNKFSKNLPPEINPKAVPLILPEDPSHAARKLYSELRAFSENNTPFYFVLSKQRQADGHWLGIWDRLKKACHILATQNQEEWNFSKK